MEQILRNPKNRERCLTVFLFALSALIVISCGKKEQQQSKEPDLSSMGAYELELVKDRKEKDLHFIRDEASPIKPSQRELFKSLDYYPPDKRFAFYTALEPLAKPELFVIATSKDKPREMLHIGYLPFSYNGATYKLSVFAPKDTSDGNYWFVPFTDATTGKETYGGGRFIDIEDIHSDSTYLDFNYAYNPYCAYNERYDCPIPPPENKLPVAILAGEKKFPLHSAH